MIIGLDVDGVLADFDGAVRSAIQDLLPDHPLPKETTAWPLREAYDLSGPERDRVIEALNPIDFDPLPAAALVPEIGYLGEVVFITASMESHPTWDWQRRRWLKRRFGSWAVPNTIFASRKDLMAGRVDILVDDKPLNALRFWEAGGKSILFDQPWNRGMLPSIEYTRANAETLLPLLKELTQKGVV